MAANPSSRFYNSHLSQICSLDVDKGIRPFRMTSVICTIGPACDDVSTLVELINGGMNICRLNMAHNSLEELGGGVHFKQGQELVLTSDQQVRDRCDRSCLYVNSQYFLEKASVGQVVLLGDGLLSLIIKDKPDHSRMLAEVVTEGSASNLCHIHIPRMVPAPVNKLTDQDRAVIRFACDQGVDMIFAAWVWTADVIKEIRQAVGENAETMKIVANIENYTAVKNINAILAEADGIMVARGDLGMDLPPEKVFLAQKNLIARANIAGKPVICAAQMLESMSVNPRPTRAEANDIANAILDGTDCVMLSSETAIGKSPVRALHVICAVAREAEMAVHHDRLYRDLRRITPVPTDCTHTTAIAAVEAANHGRASAIIVVTTSGHSATMVARYRPPCLIVAVTKSQHTVRGLHLYRGIYPVLHTAETCEEWCDDVDSRIHHAMSVCRCRGYFGPGCVVILVTGSTPVAGWTNTVRTVVVPASQEEPERYVSITDRDDFDIFD